MISNREVAAALSDLAALTLLAEGSPQAFRVRTYENAARSVADAAEPVAGMSEKELTALRGIGRSTAAKIREFVATGRIAKLDALRKEFPPAFRDLTRLPGIGPKTAVTLRDQLGIHDVDALKAAIEQQELRRLPGFGPKTEENIARAIDRLGLAGKERRTPLIEAIGVARRVADAVAEIPGVLSAEPMGSIRRFRETIGDIDVLAVSEGPAEDVMERFVGLPIVADVIAYGGRKSAVLTHAGIQVDLRVVVPRQRGSAEMYFTGSKAHNIRLRQLAIEQGRTLSEYGLADSETDEVIASATEEEVYRALGLAWVPPELREDRGEVEAAAAGTLPDVVEAGHLRGDLHVHTDLSGDGREGLDAMVAGAAARGYEYLAITDHGEDLTLNGVTRDQLLAQRREIEQLQGDHPGMRILQGCELNIAPDGTIDYDAGFLSGLDWGVASVHSAFDLDAAVQTARVVAAMENPAVNAIGHLTGRRIGRRPGIELDLEAVFDAAERTGTALEINCHLDRLDVSSDVLYAARERRVLFVISTDAHHTTELANTRWGAATARRGWVERERVVNTWPEARFGAWVEAKRAG